MNEQLKKQEEEELNMMTSFEEEAKFEEAVRAYEQIPIPEELDQMVRNTVKTHAKEHNRKVKKSAGKRAIIITMRTIGAMAAALLVFFIPLNTNEAFAKQMQSIPVIGKLAKVLTVRSYSYTENDTNVNVNAPEIVAYVPDGEEPESAENDQAQESVLLENTDITETTNFEHAMATEFVGDINKQIQEIIDSYEADAKARFAEYKEAFFATGGTEEEWGGRTCDISVDYTVTYNEGSVLSLILTTSESWIGAYNTAYYYNLDLERGEYLTLQDILGDEWVEICNESIVTQIEALLAEDTEHMLCYWGYGEDEESDMAIEGFTTVNEDTKFYINEAGNPVVCFEKYEIAPGYMGAQEFEIIRA